MDIATPYTKFHGELLDNKNVDSVIREYFPDYAYKGVFIDIGAFDPINISNSYHFERNGWDVRCFEANTNLIPELKKHRQHVYNVALYDEYKPSISFNIVESNGWTAGFSAIELNDKLFKRFKHRKNVNNIKTISIEQRTLNSYLENELLDIADKIDIVQLDIEGGELKCLYGFDLIKYKPKLLVIENVLDDSILTNYILNKGYMLDKKVKYNEYYLRKEL
jgi:FkbM family methyltransferase